MQSSSALGSRQATSCHRSLAPKPVVPCSSMHASPRPFASKPLTGTSQHMDTSVVAGASNVRRWSYDTMQNTKKKTPKAPKPPAKTEIFVMLPMDIIAVGELKEGTEASFIMSHAHDASMLDKRMSVLKKTGAEGIMLDVWWGICERHGPKQYDFSAYMQLFKKARKYGLKVQAVMSFHAGGGNVGDGACDIPLPTWVLQAGEAIGDECFYTDQDNSRDHECLSLGADHVPFLEGRTPVQVYADYIEAFATACKEKDLWGSTVVEICVGTGPCGELRYPAYQEKDSKWSYMGSEYGVPGKVTIQRGIPGIGEFQCYDKFMLEDLKAAADKVNPEWGNPPRDAAGAYDFAPWETEFFALTENAGWKQPYGQFFMEWYSNSLIKHADNILSVVAPVVQKMNGDGPKVEMAVKVAGIHWWYLCNSHAAEMTAGYYNHLKRDGYAPIARELAKHGAGLSFTCIEMSDDENPDLRHCSPERLVKQVIQAAEREGVMLMAENALEGGLYNPVALDKMAANAQHFARITLLRMQPWMFIPDDTEIEGFAVKEPLASFLRKFKHDTPSGEASSSNGAGASKQAMAAAHAAIEKSTR